MNQESFDPKTPAIKTWRAAFVSAANSSDEHPAAEVLFDGVAGRLSPAQLQLLLDHVASCPGCTEDWRLAVELQSESPQSADRPARVLPFRQRSPALIWALAAIVICSAGLGLFWPQLRQGAAKPPIFRGDELKIVAAVEASGLSRSRFELRWLLQPPPPLGTRYDLVVTTADLLVLVDIKGLEEDAFPLNAERLAGVASGDTILWRVVAHLPDGRRVGSPTFDHLLGP